jgi:hypothetical protein
MSPVSSRPEYRHASERRDVEMSIVKVGLGFVLLVAVMLGGCAALSSSTPFNPAQSCQASGGSYYNGQCHAGVD